MTKRIISVILAMLTVFSLSACKDELQAYREEMQKIITEVESMNTEITSSVSEIQDALNSMDEKAYKAAMDQLQTLSDALQEKYNAIGDMKAPDQFTEQQKLLRQYADEMNAMMQASMELYSIVYEYVCTGELSDENLERMNELEDTIRSYTDSTTAFDQVLNQVMGWDE